MLVAVLAGLAALALLVWYQSGGVSTRQRWRGDGRFGQLAPEPPWPRRPVDPDERFAVWPRRRLVVPAIAGAGLLLAGVVLVVAGVEVLGGAALAIGALEAGAAVVALRHNREALSFLEERFFDDGSRSRRQEGGS